MAGSGMGDEFEDASLVDMHTMIANAKPQDLLDRAAHLLCAAAEFISVGEGLASHIQHVEWTGEGAEAFREWTHQLAKDTVSLGEYTSAVSVHMMEAGSRCRRPRARCRRSRRTLPCATPTRPRSPALRLAWRPPVRKPSL